MSLLSEPKQHDPSYDLMDRIINVREWWTLNCKIATNEIALLDLRAESADGPHRLCHPRLKVVPFPIQYLKERSFELPARHFEFSILLDSSDLEEAQTFLLGTHQPLTKRPKKPWNVTYVILADGKIWEEARSIGILENAIVSPDVFPTARLWQPDPMVQTILFPLLKNRVSNGNLQIWDMASGAGRDVAFLAEELMAAENPYHVWGFDHRYNEKETNITRSFWKRRGLENTTKCIKVDLSSWETVTLPKTHVAALFCVRFWKPELVSAIARSSELLPGTLFGISHFCKPHVGASWDFDHPSEKTVLERTQLRDLFQLCSWEIVCDEIAVDSDHGRPMIHLVARKSMNA